jgi:hypothetical protein
MPRSTRAALLLLLAACCTLAAAQAKWQTVSGPGGSFFVDLPGAPQATEAPMKLSSGGEYTMHQLIVELDDSAFVVQSAVYPSSVDLSDPRANLQGGLDNAAKGHDGGRWLEVNWTMRQGLQAVDGVAHRGDTVIHNFSLLNGRQIIALTYAGPLGTERSAEVNRFIDSMRVAR